MAATNPVPRVPSSPVPSPTGPALPVPANDNFPRPANDNFRTRGPRTSLGPARAGAIRVLGRVLRRLFPGLLAVEAAILFNEWIRQFNYAENGRIKTGFPPSHPLFMPVGWSQRDVSVAVEAAGKPIQQFVDENSGGFAGYHWFTDTNLPADNYQTDDWVTGNVKTFIPGTAPNYAGISWIERFVKAGANGVPVGTLATGFDKWELNGGPGTETVRWIKPLEWTVPQELWPLDPAVLPSISPALQPFAVPPGFFPKPIPQPLIRPLRRLSPEEWPARERGPQRRHRDRPRQRPRPGERPNQQPRQRPEKNPPAGSLARARGVAAYEPRAAPSPTYVDFAPTPDPSSQAGRVHAQNNQKSFWWGNGMA